MENPFRPSETDPRILAITGLAAFLSLLLIAFIDKGFDTLGCPWIDTGNTLAFGKAIQKYGAMGMLETTWHISHDRNFSSIYGTAACSAWNPSAPRRTSIELRLCNALHLRQVGWDMKLTEYEKTGYSQFQVDAGQHPHQVN